jgi:hypothetical protein
MRTKSPDQKTSKAAQVPVIAALHAQWDQGADAEKLEQHTAIDNETRMHICD